MSFDETIRIRISKDLKRELQQLADGEVRDLANLARKILIDYAAAHRASRIQEPPMKYAVPGRSVLPPGKKGIGKTKEN